jgi:Carbohydrate binding domain (family 11)
MAKVVVLALVLALTGCASSTLVIRSYAEGLAGVRSANPETKLSVARDSAVSDGAVLLVEYPAATDNPAARDVWCEAERLDWTAGRAISFQAKPDHALRLSVSFIDRNRVAYTSWSDLRAGEWQTVRIAFEQIRPNPYFQPPGAQTGAPLDVSEVKAIGFAPQGPSSGRIALSRFVIVD